MKRDIITLSKFASRYLGLYGEDLKKLTHEDIELLFPLLKRSSYTYIDKNPNMLESGKILLVSDGKKLIPYYTPKLSAEYIQSTQVPKKDKNPKKENFDYSKMRIYELKQLLNTKLNGYSVSRSARHELEDRHIVLGKKYKRTEFKKWREEYERY